MNYIDRLSDNKNSATMLNYGTETSATSSFIPPQMNGGCGSLFGNPNNLKALLNQQMTYRTASTTSSNIDEGIFQLLTQNPNKLMSINDLFDQYTKDHSINFLKKDFIINCEELNTRYKNIKKYYKNQQCYLAFVTDESMMTDHISSSDDVILDKCDIIEYMISNPQYCEKMSLTDNFDGTDTILHILFRKGRIDLINALAGSYDINFDQMNARNESLLDVMDPSNQNTSKIIKMVFDNKYKKLISENQIRLNDVRHTNSILLENNRKLANENQELKKQVGDNKFYYYYAIICSIIIGMNWMSQCDEK